MLYYMTPLEVKKADIKWVVDDPEWQIVRKSLIGNWVNNYQVNDNEWHHVVWNISQDGIWTVYLDNNQIFSLLTTMYFLLLFP